MYYSPFVSFVLGGMVITGAARSVTAKLFFQLGFEHPLFLTLLYLLGQSLSLFPYAAYRQWKKRCIKTLKINDIRNGISGKVELEAYTADTSAQHKSYTTEEPSESAEVFTISISNLVYHVVAMYADELDSAKVPTCNFEVQDDPEEEEFNESTRCVVKQEMAIDASKQLRRINSAELPDKSRNAWWIEKIPWYMKPVMPAVFNLLNSAMRWAALVYIPASVAEMLISGTELILSVVATRLVRGRTVTWIRWGGIGVCTVGIIMAGYFHSMTGKSGDENDEDSDSSKKDLLTGTMLILGQSIMSVSQGK